MADSEGSEVGRINFGRVRRMWKGWVMDEEEVNRKDEEKTVAKNGESNQKKWSCGPKDFMLLLLDFVLTQTVVNMLSTSAWRGIWNLWDLYLYGGLYLAEPWGPLDITGLFQDRDYVDCAFGITVGTIFLVLSFILSPTVDRHLSTLPLVPYLIVSRALTILFFAMYMLMWRSYYNLGYLVLDDSMKILIAFGISTAILVICGCYSTVIGVPVAQEVDMGPEYSILSTRNPGSRVGSPKSILDGCVSAAVEVLGIICWFGTYEYIVLYLPGEEDGVSPLLVCVYPILCGVGTGVLALLVQSVLPPSMVCMRLARTILAGLGMFSSVFHWYGTWTLLDTFFMPAQWELSNYLSAFIGCLGLCFIGGSKALQGGVGRDWDDAPLIQPYFIGLWINWLKEKDTALPL